MRTQQERTIRAYNLHICDKDDCQSGVYPELDGTDEVPEKLAVFRGSKPDNAAFLHFYEDDYRFEALWNTPERYIETLRRYAGAIAPDFSLYTDMPLPMQQWNVYRSRVLARYWQDNGITVIPTLSFSTEDSYDFAFEGIPEGCTVAVSTVGAMRAKEDREVFYAGLQEAVERVKPKTLLVYGGKFDQEMQLPCKVVRFKNSNNERMKEHGKRSQRRTRYKIG